MTNISQILYYLYHPLKREEGLAVAAMRRATTYKDWKLAAERRDQITRSQSSFSEASFIVSGKDLWKVDPQSREYNSTVLTTRLRSLREARLSSTYIGSRA